LADAIAILSLGVSLLPFVKNEIDKYLQKNKVRTELFEGLKTKIDNYQESFQTLIAVSPNRIFPCLEAMEKRIPSKTEMEEITEANAELYFAFSDWINDFIALAARFKTISANNPAFMEQLKKSDGFLYDFVFQVSRMSKTNQLVIGEGFFVFAQMHKRELKKIFDDKEDEKSLERARREIELAKKIGSYVGTPVSQETTQLYLEALKEFRKASQKVHISKELVANLDDYILPQLKPVMAILKRVSFGKHINKKETLF
jgi:hypothetical protein